MSVRLTAPMPVRVITSENGISRPAKLELKMPELRYAKFEAEIINRYCQKEFSVEEALMEMYLAGVSGRRGEDLTEPCVGSEVSASTVSDPKEMYEGIETWRNRAIEGVYPYVHLDGICLNRSWD